MISADEALNIIVRKESKILEVEKKDILSALNRVLAEDVYSKENLPPFNKSAMDGFAVRSEDTQYYKEGQSLEFKIKGVIKAGDYCEQKLEKGEAFKIMTGAALPYGADSVIEIEKVKSKDDKLYIGEVVKKYNNVIKLGEEIEEGELALSKGTIIRPAEIGALASLGYENVKVYKNPTIALIITGDELVDVNSKLEKGKIRNSNEHSLKALIKSLDCEILSFGIVSDEKHALKEKVEDALDKADIVISSGGASVGDYDFVKETLKDIGADIKFDKVAIKPGKPTTFAVYKNKLFFALPGNPLALITTFEEFVKPAILKMQGKSGIFKNEFPVILADDFRAKVGRKKYIYANIKKEKNGYYAYKIGSQCSNHLMTISKANGIVVIPEECSGAKAGEVLSGKFIFK